ncbi:hypothetical protein FJY71_01590 [candidate division WOR-3 bacterium]|nr:hypothetical protein [candidate division WOR-3 bacterium]
MKLPPGRQPLWAGEELEVLARHLEALEQGRHASADAAAAACFAELNGLRGRILGSGHAGAWVPPQRTLWAVRVRLLRSRKHGPVAPDWTPAEERVIGRFAQAVAAREYRGTLDAGMDCLAELKKLRAVDPALPARSVGRVRARISRYMRESGQAGALSHWSAAERRLCRDVARQYTRGRFPTRRAAARECITRIRVRFGRERTLDGVCWHLSRELRAAGVPALERTWSAADLRVLERHLRMVYSGRLRTVRDAAVACSGALGGRHRPETVRERLKPLVAATGLPRCHGFMLPWELKLVERHARRAAQEEPPDWTAAAEACRRDMNRRQAALSRSTHGFVRPDYARSATLVRAAILRMALKLGLRRRVRFRWSPEEHRMMMSWVKWYRRYRGVRRLRPRAQAAEGLQEELADRGFRRSVNACALRLHIYANRYP